MTAKRRLLKTVDEVADIRCAAGNGLLREEVWEDEDGKVQRYNLAFINHFMTSKDNGRVLVTTTAMAIIIAISKARSIPLLSRTTNRSRHSSSWKWIC